MKATRDPAGAGPIIHGLGPRGFRVEERHHPALLLTVADAIDWTPPALATLDESALAPILDPAPEFILLGTGARLSPVPSALIRSLDRRGIGIEAMDSRAAARAWGVLRGEGRVIAAAIYPLDIR